VNTSSFELDSWSFEYNENWYPNLPDTPTYRLESVDDLDLNGGDVTDFNVEAIESINSLMTSIEFDWDETDCDLGYTTPNDLTSVVINDDVVIYEIYVTSQSNQVFVSLPCTTEGDSDDTIAYEL